MKRMAYGLSVRLDAPQETARRLVVDALKREGFGILTEIDVSRTLKEKLGVESAPYVILGACNPALAYEVLQQDIEAGLLLPCNVAVRRDGEETVVSVLDPLVMSELSPSPGMCSVAARAREKIERALSLLTDESTE